MKWNDHVVVRDAVSVKNTQEALFMKYQGQQINERLNNAINHASAGMWGFFKEGPSHSVDASPAYLAADIMHAGTGPHLWFGR
jgi:hypothetical protein